MNPLVGSMQSILTSPPPWWSTHLSVMQQLCAAAEARSIADALNSVRAEREALPRFVEHASLPSGEAYEAYIARTDCVPTRDNLHDLFNGVIWLGYPKSKRRLNVLQSQEISRHGASGARGPLRDAMTVFDENAAVLQAPVALVDALRRRDWNTLFVKERECWQSARLVVFGHALLEKLIQPRKPITAHVWVVDELTDESLAASLDPERLMTRNFMPLPVLGVPGWWPANEQPGFYDDADVFRAARIATAGA